jgi:hypothetical protein
MDPPQAFRRHRLLGRASLGRWPRTCDLGRSRLLQERNRI